MSEGVAKAGDLVEQRKGCAAELFEMPAGLRKFDPRALIEQIKQSDVWVDQPVHLPRTQP